MFDFIWTIILESTQAMNTVVQTAVSLRVCELGGAQRVCVRYRIFLESWLFSNAEYYIRNK